MIGLRCQAGVTTFIEHKFDLRGASYCTVSNTGIVHTEISYKYMSPCMSRRNCHTVIIPFSIAATEINRTKEIWRIGGEKPWVKLDNVCRTCMQCEHKDAGLGKKQDRIVRYRYYCNIDLRTATEIVVQIISGSCQWWTRSIALHSVSRVRTSQLLQLLRV